MSDTKKSARPATFSKNFLAGGLAGTVGATILCPLEVVKTRLQVSCMYLESAFGAHD
jgi:hypothetical protein